MWAKMWVINKIIYTKFAINIFILKWQTSSLD